MTIEDTTTDLVTTAIAVVSLALSLYLFITQRFANREAHVEPRLERYRNDPDDLGSAVGRRIVLTNHGPARADDVVVRALADDGSVRRVLRTGHNDKTFRHPMMWPGQEVHIEVFLPMGASPPDHVEVSWDDKRLGRQRRDYHVTDNRV